MPHQCVRCNTLYPDGAQEILKGCSCGARLFFYIKKKDVEEGQKLVSNLSSEDKVQIEKDVTNMLNVKTEDPNKPVILELEAIRVLRPGKYELDLVHLFKKDPLVIKLEEGKYIIDLAQVFKEGKDQNNSRK
ncbi:hypothetical protein COY27_05170 [Candidatus Woesearchaeota archaeon CG_4_10_14_0_2_um_filter_33_13]|nr:MAG: hypothetical protein COY27_05170 [Candidatus Woesearchaeota archaeon CG_4_10_14_0_2_um_filter_33_13]